MITSPKTKGARVYILLPGIHTKPSDNNNWAPAMASAIGITYDTAKAEEFRYYSSLFHKNGMKERVGFVIDLCHRWWSAGYEVVIVGHSDGCEIVRQVLIEGPSIFKAAHLIAGAVEADFKENGLLKVIEDNKVETIFCYVSKGDKVIDKWARASIRFLSWLKITFGTLGFDGPKNVPEEMIGSRVVIIERMSLRHSEWFSGVNWQSTFNSITRLEF